MILGVWEVFLGERDWGKWDGQGKMPNKGVVSAEGHHQPDPTGNSESLTVPQGWLHLEARGFGLLYLVSIYHWLRATGLGLGMWKLLCQEAQSRMTLWRREHSSWGIAAQSGKGYLGGAITVSSGPQRFPSASLTQLQQHILHQSC